MSKLAKKLSIAKRDEYAIIILRIFEKQRYEYGISAESVRKYIDINYKNHKQLNEAIGLCEDNDFRKPVDIGLPDTYVMELAKKLKYRIAKTYNIGAGEIFFNVKENECMIGNNNYKLSKVLLRTEKEYKDTIRRFINITNHHLKLAYGKGARSKEEYTDVEEMNLVFDALKSYTYPVYISTNPIDFLVLSTFTSYSSCFRLPSGDDPYGGEYCAGTLVYGTGVNSFVIYLPNEFKDGHPIYKGRILGAAIVEDGEVIKVACTKPYGNIPLEYVKQVIINGMNDKLVKSAFELKFDSYNDIAYLDETMVAMKVNGQDTDHIFMDSEPICLQCGYELDNAQGLRCSDCFDENDEDYTYCVNCDERIHIEDAYYYNDEPYCHSCFQDYYSYCEWCDETYPHDDIYLAKDENGDDIYICIHCAENEGYVECSNCGTLCHPNYADEVIDRYGDTENMCRHCIENDNYVSCEECGTYIHIDRACEIDDVYYCPDCAPEDKDE